MPKIKKKKFNSFCSAILFDFLFPFNLSIRRSQRELLVLPKQKNIELRRRSIAFYSFSTIQLHAPDFSIVSFS